MSVSLAAIATGVMLVSTIAAEIDSALRARNAKKARRLSEQLDAVTRKYNLNRANLEEAMRKVNLNYDNLMNSLSGISRASTAKTIQDKALVEYKDKMSKLNENMTQNQRQYEKVNDYLTQQVNKRENKGLHDTLGGLFN